MQRINPYRMFVGSFIPNGLLRHDKISAGAKLLWARLSQYAGDEGWCYPKQETLAEELGCTRKTVSKYIKELMNNEFIELEKPTASERRKGASTRYYFLNHPVLNSFVGEKKEEIVKTVEEKVPSAQDKKESALSSYENYREYMKLDSVIVKDINDWTARDFVTVFYCGMSKYNFEHKLTVRLPVWTKDASAMKVAMETYGRPVLNNIIIAMCTKKHLIDQKLGKSLQLGMSVFSQEWIIQKVIEVVSDRSVDVMKSFKEKEKRVSAKAQEEALKYRTMLKEKQNGKRT